MSQLDAVELYRRMLRIRRFEERTAELYAAGAIPGFVHVSVGQEATAVGGCWPLRDTDAIVSNHRGHGHCLAKGTDAESMFAELMGKATGTGGGMGGSMHIADFERGVYGANGIVGAGLPIGVGVAQGFRQQRRDDVVVVFFGDGAIAQGTFHESLNLAALWRLPVLFLCENNQYAEFSPTQTQHPVPVVQRAAAYGIEAASVDGNDVFAVADIAVRFVERMRGGHGPFLLEAVTYRRRGHFEGDATKYRPGGELADWATRDPLSRLATYLDEQGLHADRTRVEAAVAAELRTAEVDAREAPYPRPGAFLDMVSVPEPVLATMPAPPQQQPKFKVMNAIHDALEHALREDPRVMLAGIDIADGGNIFGLTRGLHAEFGPRVLDTPISESAVVGMAVGAAMTGMKPVVEIMYLDFVGVCFDQIMNQAAKLHFMTGGRAPMSLVIRTQFGSGRSSAAQHSQSLEALLAHVPGLTVLMPSTTEDVYGLLRSAIDSPNPVVFIEHRLTYGKKGPTPPPGLRIPIGEAAIRRPGADVTLVSWSRMVDWAMEAADLAAADGIDVEVIDLRTIQPLDEAAILASVRKTNRLVIAHEAVVSGGFGAEIAARVCDAAIWHLDAPVKRVAPPSTPAPYSPPQEAEWLPGVKEIADAIRDVMVDS
ncbi:dehydrogenase E1 component subunit alpha/beta [Mycobacterium marseillense]|uniref:alpha-ketoacid dehydrogenase subunit alpha/beta n=1 Tax=Mycobacterium avium complex (MAC) TaxID=120793 RepID=UPI0004AFF145|nr:MULTISPECIES: dehydrogenase E1 component subunit alpha/beta [Mycobacterium avium complex (MAC)]MDM3973574.1 dehydrogenase E1 component subunit alpha/beta [Mycobacterium marseillense]